MRILLVEDDETLRSSLATRLRAAGFAVEEAANGTDGLYMAKEFPLDAAVVDLGLPDMDGVDLIRSLRRDGGEVPLLVLTARDQWQAKVEGLEAGADDYLTKPFQPEELLARLRALIRRAGGWTSDELACGPYVLDMAARSLRVDGETLTLTAFEYRVLECLMLHAGRVLSKTFLSEHLYEEEIERDSNVLEVIVGRLRRKLDPERTRNPIETSRGQGYRFSFQRSEPDVPEPEPEP